MPLHAPAQIQRKMADLQRRLLLAERRLEEERDRTAALAPYRVAAPKRGVIGGSRYAKLLRQNIVLAARDPTRCARVFDAAHGARHAHECGASPGISLLTPSFPPL